MITRPTRLLAHALIIVLAGCATSAPEKTASTPASTHAPTPAPVPELRPGVPAGYLGRAVPDSLALLPAPPAAGSPAFAQDQAIHATAQKLRTGARAALATSDADLHFPHAAHTFDCALGRSIDANTTPRLYLLLQRTMIDGGMAPYRAKDNYKRERPFVHYKETTCLPADEAALRTDGSYPSGHTSIGWTWGLVLVAVAPDRADALLARARAFGESRLICNAHWQSDIIAGRTIAAATVAKLHTDPVFQSDVIAAREELAHAAEPDAAQCAAETALLAPIPGAL